MDDARHVLGIFPSHVDASLPPKQYDAALKQYASAAGKLPKEARAAILANPIALLQTMEPSDNTIGYLTVLDILHSDNVELPSQVLDMTFEFLLKFDPLQVAYVGSTFLSLLGRIASGTVFPPQVAIELLVMAILRLDPTGSVFTSTHLALAKLVYATNVVEPALEVLDADILFYPAMPNSKETKHVLCDPELPQWAAMSPMTGLTEQLKSGMVLEYNLLRGLIYISRRDWPKAHAALEQIITHPLRNKSVGRTMIEAYKKWLLVGLLHQGKAPCQPSCISAGTQANFHAASEHYSSFARLFSTDQVDSLRKTFETNRQTWEEDGNGLLMAEVMSAYQKWQIVNLRQIYQRVPVSEVRRATLDAETGEPSPDDQTTLALVRDMIESGMLRGEVEMGHDGGESYLAFDDPQGSITEAEFAREVAHSRRRLELLSGHYLSANERLSGNKEYLRHLIREQKRAEVEKEADAAIGFETQIEDEDLMTGVLAHA